MTMHSFAAQLSAIPRPLLGVLGGILGLIVGSYGATILIRWPRSGSASFGRSHCDSCERQLSWYELIPVLSFLAACGKCRSCKGRIAWRHLAVEAAFGAAAAIFFAAGLPGAVLAVWLLILLAFFDAFYLWLPDRLIALLAVAALITPRWIFGLELSDQLIGGGIGFSVLWIVSRLFRRATGREGMGGGDPKLFGAIGLLLGWHELPFVLLAACAVGLLDAAIRHRCSASMRKVQLPFGSYLAIATICFGLWHIIDPADPLRGSAPSEQLAALRTPPVAILPESGQLWRREKAILSD